MIEFIEGLGKLPQPCRGQHVTDDLDQALDLGVVSQAAHGVRGLAAFDAGGLPRMQQQAVVEQQTQRRFCKVSEHPSTVVRFPVTEAEEPPKASYQITRFNALKHGILARLVMLPHEDAGEFADLLAALVEEHQPTGATEAHLVAELAAIMWRQRRVLLAEGAAINAGLPAVTKRSFDSPIESAMPFERALSGKGADVRKLVTATPDDIAERQRQAALDRQATERAAAILGKGGANAYDKALRALPADSRDGWREWVEDEEGYEATAEGLAEFIHDHLLPACIRNMKEIQHQPAIKAQTLGEGLQVHRLEKLNRYETHLDRKFERTLAMLVKLKELRGNN